MSQNKPLAEYGSLASQHHTDRQREQQPTPGESNEPPRLVVVKGLGNMLLIAWDKENGAIPLSCEGFWNHKQTAQNAIDMANAHVISDTAQMEMAAGKEEAEPPKPKAQKKTN